LREKTFRKLPASGSSKSFLAKGKLYARQRFDVAISNVKKLVNPVRKKSLENAAAKGCPIAPKKKN
jgi:hypothetical protein